MRHPISLDQQKKNDNSSIVEQKNISSVPDLSQKIDATVFRTMSLNDESFAHAFENVETDKSFFIVALFRKKFNFYFIISKLNLPLNARREWGNFDSFSSLRNLHRNLQ